MTHLIAIGGSPSVNSKSTQLLERALLRAKQQKLTGKLFSVRDVPPNDLIFGTGEDNPHVKKIIDQLEISTGVIIATPIYKAAYSGALKALLDLLPQKALSGKVVLPIATGGSEKHLLAIDYALKPVLFALGATQVLNGIYISDYQVERDSFGQLNLDREIALRFDEQVDTLVQEASLLRSKEAVLTRSVA